MADVLGSDLVSSGPEIVIRTFGLLRFRGAKKGRVGSRMRSGIRVGQFQVRDGGDLITNGCQRIQDGRKLIKRVFAARRPATDIAAHGHEHVPKTADRLGGCFIQRHRGRNHRVKQWKRDGGTDTAQHGSPAD